MLSLLTLSISCMMASFSNLADCDFSSSLLVLFSKRLAESQNFSSSNSRAMILVFRLSQSFLASKMSESNAFSSSASVPIELFSSSSVCFILGKGNNCCQKEVSYSFWQMYLSSMTRTSLSSFLVSISRHLSQYLSTSLRTITGPSLQLHWQHFKSKLIQAITSYTYILIQMQGGLFGLSKSQTLYLYSSQLIPTFIVLMERDAIRVLLLLQAFYLVNSAIYISFMSIEKSMYTYTFHEFSKKNYQIEKGLTLAGSAYLLITVYGILILKIGKFVLPKHIQLGDNTQHFWWVFFFFCLINPFLEEWYWRLFLPKTFQLTYQKSHLINATYLVFHFVLFSSYLGFWRAVPFVTTFFSVGRSMSHIKQKYGIISAIITHYGITFAAFSLYTYIKLTTNLMI